jgi:hypothetical protein
MPSPSRRTVTSWASARRNAVAYSLKSLWLALVIKDLF